MIDVMKRLAELDSTNNNVIKESAGIKECGPMGMMDSMGGMEKPSTPASMNITAGSGDELAHMLATIMQMSGGKKDSPGQMGAEPGVEIMTAEPEIKVEPMSGGDAMRSMIDKLNPMDDEGGDDVSKAHGDFDNDGDHDMDDHEKEKDDEEETDESYDNSPNPETEGYGAFAAHGDMDKNPAGGGDVPKDHDSRPRVRTQPVATFESLMDDYKKFVAETQLDEISDQLANRSFNKRQANYDAAKQKYGDSEYGSANDARLKYLGNQDKQTNRIRKNDATGPNATGQMGSIKTRAQAAPDPYRNSSGSMEEGEGKTMSRAAKGIMKYGKDGMQALRDAEAEGKDLDKVRDKYNKYKK